MGVSTIGTELKSIGLYLNLRITARNSLQCKPTDKVCPVKHRSILLIKVIILLTNAYSINLRVKDSNFFLTNIYNCFSLLRMDSDLDIAWNVLPNESSVRKI